MTLSRPQIDALRYVNGRQLYAETINEGDGNMRRSILSLFKLGLLGWDPIYLGRAMLTPAGGQAIAAAREVELAAKAKLGVIDKNKLREIDMKRCAAKQKLSRIVKEAKSEVSP